MYARATYRYGLALVKQGQVAEGLAQFHASMDALQGMQSGDAKALRLTQLAELYRCSGQSEAGLHALAAAMAADTEERFDAAGRYRSQGELLLLLPDPELHQAETCFQQALAVARCQQAKSSELRAAISLSQLWQRHGKWDDARKLLAPIYGWFTEGFDTADLQEVKALLKALA
jgi:predicted ATPase